MRIDELDFKKIKKPGEVVNYSDNKLNKAFNRIEILCNEYLSIVRKSKNILYRGAIHKNIKSKIFMANSKPRVSVEGNKATNYQKLCDTYLSLAGFKALRGNSIFTNSEYRMAKFWGNTYLIFPLNGFEFTYSKKYSGVPAADYEYPSFEVNGQEIYDYDYSSKSMLKYFNRLKSSEQIELSKKFVATNQFNCTDLKYGLTEHKDLWFTGNYIAISMDLCDIDKIQKFLGFKLK